jgi:hypothetical protein
LPAITSPEAQIERLLASGRCDNKLALDMMDELPAYWAKAETSHWPARDHRVPWRDLAMRAKTDPTWPWLPGARGLEVLRDEALKQGRWRQTPEGHIEKGLFPPEQTSVNVTLVNTHRETGETSLALIPRNAGDSPCVYMANMRYPLGPWRRTGRGLGTDPGRRHLRRRLCAEGVRRDGGDSPRPRRCDPGRRMNGTKGQGPRTETEANGIKPAYAHPTLGFGVPATSDPHHVVVQIPRGGTAPVLIREHLGMSPGGLAGEGGWAQVLDRVLLDRPRWTAIRAAVQRAFNARLAEHNLAPGTWRVGETPIDRLLGKELCVLAWAIEHLDPEHIGIALPNWLALRPEERWWLFGMTPLPPAASGIPRRAGGSRYAMPWGIRPRMSCSSRAPWLANWRPTVKRPCPCSRTEQDEWTAIFIAPRGGVGYEFAPWSVLP